MSRGDDPRDEDGTSPTLPADSAALSPTLAADAPALSPTLPASDPHAFLATMPAGEGQITPDGLGMGDDGAETDITPEDPGRYERGAEIGRGGMGHVVVAVDKHLRREVAIKELLQHGKPAVGASTAIAHRFVREARITGQLQHPSIVPVYELGKRDDGTLYIAMKRIRGRSLAAVLRDATDLEARLELLGHFRKICDAIAYAHSRGVVHRDLKPDNVMVGEFGETLVVDWGLAKAVDEGETASDLADSDLDLSSPNALQTVHGHAVGTPAYMSPEQAKGELASVDERSDVWGLGAILYEILTGRAPYLGDDARSIIEQVRKRPPDPVTEVSPDVPPELAAIVERALRPNRSSRYAAVEQLAADVDAWLAGRHVHAYDYSAYERLKRFAARNRGVSIAVMAGLVAALAASAAVWQAYSSEHAARLIEEARRTTAEAEVEEAAEADRAARSRIAGSLGRAAVRALRAQDHAGAAVFAAGALADDPAASRWMNEDSPRPATREERAEEERVVRALSTLIEAERGRTFAFERRLPSVHGRVALSPDGRRLAASIEGRLALVELVSGDVEMLDAEVSGVDGLLDDGRLVALGPAAGVYDAAGERVLELPSNITGAALTSSHVVVARLDGTLVSYELESGESRTHPRVEPGGWSLRVSGDGEALTLFGAGGAHVGSFPPTVPPPALRIAASARGAAISPDRTRVAVALEHAAIFVAHPPGDSGERIATSDWARDVAWLRDGRLVSSERGRVVIRRGSTVLDSLHVPESDGDTLHTAGDRVIIAVPVGERGAGATVFRRQGSPSRATRAFENGVRDFALDVGHHRLVAATAGGVMGMSLTRRTLGTGTRVATPSNDLGLPAAIAVARNDGAIAVYTTRGALVLLERGAARRNVVQEPWREADRASGGVVFSRDGLSLFAAGPSGSVIRYSRDSEVLDTILEVESEVTALDFSAGEPRLAVASREGVVYVWDEENERVSQTTAGHEGGVTAIAFSARGWHLASGDGHGWVQIYDVRTEVVGLRVRVHRSAVTGIGWSDTGAHLATAGIEPGIRVSIAASMRLRRIVPTVGNPRALAFEEGELWYADGPHIVRIPEERPLSARTRPELLVSTERRAGMRLVGTELVAREAP